MASYSLSHLADHVLSRALAAALAQDRSTTATLLAHLAEFDARRLFLPAGYPSMHAYCVQHLHLSESAAFKRIEAARRAREFPALFSAVAEGRLHLTAVLLLGPRLTRETADELIAAATHKCKAEIELLLAQRFPCPDVATRVTPLPPATAAPQLAPERVEPRLAAEAPLHTGPSAPHPRLAPLAPGRFALQVTLAQATHEKLAYAQALLGHAVPSGDLAQVLDRALEALILQLERRKFAATTRSRPVRRATARGGEPDARRIPAHIRRAVWQRDGGQCTFVSDNGHRCEARTRLELDHVDPIARGGQTTVANLRLRCRAHNQYAAERVFGVEFMRGKREQARRRTARARESVEAKARQAATATVEVQRGAHADVIPWLRALGFRAGEAMRAADACVSIADAPLEERVRFALRSLAPAGARRIMHPASSAP